MSDCYIKLMQLQLAGSYACGRFSLYDKPDELRHIAAYILTQQG